MSESKQTNTKKELWRKHIEAWKVSNLSQNKYCEQENISLASFSWWRTKGLKNTVSFVPATVKPHVPIMTNDIQLIFPNQTKLVLPSNLAVNDLISLIKALGGLS